MMKSLHILTALSLLLQTVTASAATGQEAELPTPWFERHVLAPSLSAGPSWEFRPNPLGTWRATSRSTLDLWLGLHVYPDTTRAPLFISLGATGSLIDHGEDVTEFLPGLTTRLGGSWFSREVFESFAWGAAAFPYLSLYGLAGWRAGSRWTEPSWKLGVGISSPFGGLVYGLAAASSTGAPFIPTALEWALHHEPDGDTYATVTLSLGF